MVIYFMHWTVFFKGCNPYIDSILGWERSAALLCLEFENQNEQKQESSKSYTQLYFLNRTFWKVTPNCVNDWHRNTLKNFNKILKKYFLKQNKTNKQNKIK